MFYWNTATSSVCLRHGYGFFHATMAESNGHGKDIRSAKPKLFPSGPFKSTCLRPPGSFAELLMAQTELSNRLVVTIAKTIQL